MKRISIIAVAIFASIASSFAQDSSTSTPVMAFSAIPADPAALAMGANTALASSMAWGASSNVSALPFNEQKFAAAATYQLWQPSAATSTNNVGAGVSSVIGGKLGVSASFMMDMSKPYDIYDAEGVNQGKFTPNDMMASFGLSYKTADFLSVGVGAHYMRSSLAEDYSMSAFGVDVLATAKFSAIDAVFGVKSLGPKVAGCYTPGSILGAVGYHSSFSGDHAVKADAQLNYYLMGGMNAAFGAEYTYADLVSARAGYNLSMAGVLPSFASLGLGVNVSGVSLNLCYLLGSEMLANTLAFGLGYSF